MELNRCACKILQWGWGVHLNSIATNTKQKSALALMGKESCVSLCLSLCSKFRPLPYTVCVTRYKWGVCLSLSACHNPDYCCCFRVPTAPGADRAGDATSIKILSPFWWRWFDKTFWWQWFDKALANDQPLTTLIKWSATDHMCQALKPVPAGAAISIFSVLDLKITFLA